MTIRRRLHVYTDGDEESFHRTLHYAQRRPRDESPAATRPLHPALTDYGPETLGAFIRRQIEDARADTTLGSSPVKDVKGKGRSLDQTPPANIIKATSPQTFSPRPMVTGSPRTRVDRLHARHLHNDQLVRPATVSLAPSALRNLRNRSLDGQAAASGQAAHSPLRKGPSTPRKTRRYPRKKSTTSKAKESDDDPFIDSDDDDEDLPDLTDGPEVAIPAAGGALVFPLEDTGSSATSMRNGKDSTAPNASASATLTIFDPNPGRIMEFDYNQIIPIEMPNLVIPGYGASPTLHSNSSNRRNRRNFWPRFRQRFSTASAAPDGPLSDGDDSDSEDEERPFSPSDRVSDPYADPNIFAITNESSLRVFSGSGPPPSLRAPPNCPLPDRADYQIPSIPSDVWISVTEYLSLPDIHSLRLVNRSMAAEISPLQFRNLVAPLGRDMQLLGAHRSDSILAKHGSHVSRFGIAFEYDPSALAFAKGKNNMQTQQAWYGSFEWPSAQYTRFKEIQELEDLVDNNNSMLENVLGHLGSVWELGLSVDSGHGWLQGPDISDMALFDLRQKKGSKVFGQAFENEHLWQAYGRDEYFKWAQQNSINEALKDTAAARAGTTETTRLVDTLSRMQVRDRASFHKVESQPDYDPHSHTGGQVATGVPGQAPVQAPQPPPAPGGMQPAGVAIHANAPPGQTAAFAAAAAQTVQALHHHPGATQHLIQAAHHAAAHFAAAAAGPGNANHVQRQNRLSPRTPKRKSKNSRKLPLQWPLIFNGYNLAAETGGMIGGIQPHVADPRDFPLLPGSLTEAQAQWLMETYWAQRSFLSAYTGAVIANRMGLRQLRVLNIAKISSGLLPSLGQAEFWAALPNLKRLRLLVSPDWRKEHFYQGVFIQKALIISPLSAVGKFAAFLHEFICKLENLSHATFGWVGGGEHAVGICARNQNLLPAPIVGQASQWITDDDPKHQPDHRSMIKFDHIRDLTFENCWFSPVMLETFMHKSQDTSLHTITLDSVSMLARHHTGTGELGLTTLGSGLQCLHEEEDWLNEEIPASATWTQTLDRVTPGSTMLERKYKAGMINSQEHPMPAPEFRGHVQKIVLKSCGYAKIEGIKSNQFNQSQLVVQPGLLGDAGLAWRATVLRGSVSVHGPSTGERPSTVLSRYGAIDAHSRVDPTVNIGPLMLSISEDPFRDEWHGLGTLTQCVHPIEKRLLEQAWGMQFGWGDTLDRWGPVEDGKLEGGTGRFSGVVLARGAEDDQL